MANMFSGHIKKQIPKNMEDCIKPDSVSTNLWVWCERLEKLGKFLFWILLIGGLILSISSSIVEKEVIVREATYWSDAETEVRTTFDFELFISLLLDTVLYAFLEYCAYHIIALLIGALASIVQNAEISANVALYNLRFEENINAKNPNNDNCEVKDLNYSSNGESENLEDLRFSSVDDSKETELNKYDEDKSNSMKEFILFLGLVVVSLGFILILILYSIAF